MDLLKNNQRGASGTATQKSVEGPSTAKTLDLRELRSSRNQSPAPAAKAQREDFQTRIHPGRVRDSAQQQVRNRRPNNRQESREERAARKDREAQARVRQQKAQQERAQEIQTQREVTDNLTDERSLATNKTAQLSDRGSSSTEGIEAGRVDLGTELAREAVREGGSAVKLGTAPQEQTDTAQGSGLTTGASTATTQAVDLRQVVHVFANRSFAETAWYQQVMSFFANVEPVDLDEREREKLLSEIENLTAAELTPEKLIRLIMLGSVCKEALSRVQEKVRELGDKAPASAEEIGALMLKGIEQWKKADEVAFDPRNN